MSSVRRKLSFGGGLLLCVLLLVLGSRLMSPRGPGVDVSGAEFGTAWAQSDYHCQLLVHNRSGRALKLLDVETSCHCTAVPQRSGDLPLNSSLPVEMYLDLSLDESKLPREFSSTIILIVDNFDGDSAERVPVRVHGWIQPNPIVLEDGAVDFGELVRGYDPDPTRRVSLSLSEPLRNLEVRAEGDCVSHAQLLRASTGREAILEVSVDPNLPYGPFGSTVELSGIPEGSDRPMAYRVPVSGRTVTDVRAVPAQISYGARLVGSTLTQTVTIQSRTGTRLGDVRLVAVPRGTYVGEQRRTGDKMGFALELVQSIAEPGFHEAALELEVLREDVTVVDNLRVPIVYHGVRRVAHLQGEALP